MECTTHKGSRTLPIVNNLGHRPANATFRKGRGRRPTICPVDKENISSKTKNLLRHIFQIQEGDFIIGLFYGQMSETRGRYAHQLFHLWRSTPLLVADDLGGEGSPADHRSGLGLLGLSIFVPHRQTAVVRTHGQDRCSICCVP